MNQVGRGGILATPIGQTLRLEHPPTKQSHSLKLVASASTSIHPLQWRVTASYTLFHPACKERERETAVQTDIPIPILLLETLFSRPLFTGLRNEPTLSPGEPSSKTCLLSISTLLSCCPRRPRNVSSRKQPRWQSAEFTIECSFAGWLISMEVNFER